MYRLIFLSILFFTTLLGIVYPVVLYLIALLSFLGIIYLLFQQQKGSKPQRMLYKEIQKSKKKRFKIEKNKHKHINDQIAYISAEWGYTKTQEKIIEQFIAERAYSEMYNKLTASLFPQMITLIEYCNARKQKGCKREVSKRLRALTLLMKKELKKKKMLKHDSYETTLAVYDQLLQS